MNAPATFPSLLAALLRSDPGRPLVTYYDDATGERTELSVVTYANWVSKNANLLVEELDVEPGDTVLLDLPPHWLVPVFLGAAWSVGASVTRDPSAPHRVVVCGPDTVAEVAEHAADDVTVLACSLHPFATAYAQPLPPGVVDHGTAWPGQSDVLVAPEPVTGDDVAVGGRTQAELLAEAAAHDDAGRRLLTDHHPADDVVGSLLAPLVGGGSVVLAHRADPGSWEHRATQERADVVRRSDPSAAG